MTKATICWDNPERTAIRFDVKTGCDWIEFWGAVHEAYHWMEEVDHQVDLIVYPEPGATPPVRAMMHFKDAQESSPLNRGRLVIVGADAFATLLFNTFTRVYRRLGEDMLFVLTLDNARAALAARDGDGHANPNGTANG